MARSHSQPRVSELGLADGVLPAGVKLIFPCVLLICHPTAAPSALPPPPSSPRSLLPLELPQEGHLEKKINH